jgi:hypothetical protein
MVACPAYQDAQHEACECVRPEKVEQATRERLEYFLEENGATEELADEAIDALLKKYKGQEPTMFLRLLKKYPKALKADPTRTRPTSWTTSSRPPATTCPHPRIKSRRSARPSRKTSPWTSTKSCRLHPTFNNSADHEILKTNQFELQFFTCLSCRVLGHVAHVLRSAHVDAVLLEAGGQVFHSQHGPCTSGRCAI